MNNSDLLVSMLINYSRYIYSCCQNNKIIVAVGKFQVRNFCRLEEVHENFIGDNFCGMLKQLHRWMWHAQNFVIVGGPQLRIQAPSNFQSGG